MLAVGGKPAVPVAVFVVGLVGVVVHAREEKPAAGNSVSTRKLTALTVVNVFINVQAGKPANPVPVVAAASGHAQAAKPAATGCASL